MQPVHQICEQRIERILNVLEQSFIAGATEHNVIGRREELDKVKQETQEAGYLTEMSKFKGQVPDNELMFQLKVTLPRTKGDGNA